MSESKAQKQPVSGKGKLTQEKMLKIQNYYSKEENSESKWVTA